MRKEPTEARRVRNKTLPRQRGNTMRSTSWALLCSAAHMRRSPACDIAYPNPANCIILSPRTRFGRTRSSE